MLSHVTPILLAILSWTCHCQYNYDPRYGLPFNPYFNDYYPPFAPEEVLDPLSKANPVATSYSNFNLNTNPFVTGQQQQQQNQIQPNYPNLPQLPFQTIKPTQKTNQYPFPNYDLNFNTLNQNNNQQQQGVPSFANNLVNPAYPNLPTLPFQTISPGNNIPPYLNPFLNQNLNNLNPPQPKIELPKIRVIEFPSSEYFKYGGGKLVQPKRPNADLYVGGSGGDVPMTSKIFIECTGPHQVEWLFSGNNETGTKKELSTVTKNFQITIPEERGPTPGSKEYTYLRLGLEESISAKDAGVYTCRDRVLPQNYITIRVIVAKPVTGRPNYPFRPAKDPNTIFYTDSDNSIVLPCKIENADATISLHKHEQGKLSCPYTMDGRVLYDRYRGFIMQTKAFNDLEGRYVCVGDFNGELRLMKYKVVRSNDFTSRFVQKEPENVVSLVADNQKSASSTSGSPSSSTLLAKVDTLSNSLISGLIKDSNANLTGAGLVDPRSEFVLEPEGFTLDKDKKGDIK